MESEFGLIYSIKTVFSWFCTDAMCENFYIFAFVNALNGIGMDSGMINDGAEEKKIRKMRVSYKYADEEWLYVFAFGKEWKVRYNVPGLNDAFTQDIPFFWKDAPLNLLDVTIDEMGILSPSFIVLDPDYLMDISSLAECFREYGNHPANYFMNRLMPIENARPLLLGNIANLFLDEWVYAGEQEPDYLQVMQKAFRQYPVELAACEDLRDPQKEREFFIDCRMHFDHIHEVVQHTFTESVYRLDKADAVLEPSYICEALGLQGRLDYMQRDMSAFIEMKSGKADEYAMKGKVVPKENNRVQMLLYMAVLEYSMDCHRNKQRPYLLYTRYPLLYPARASWAQVKRIISLRNRIVAAEYGVQLHNHSSYTLQILSQINPQALNERGLRGRFWEQYLVPQITRFQERFGSLDVLEKEYCLTLYHFITKELYLSKTGRMDGENKMGMAALWLNTLEEKREAGEILYDLKMIENHASEPRKAYVVLSIPCYQEDFLPNFRDGDVVLFYERNQATDNATNKMVYKGNIERITDTQVCIRLRAAQRNTALFPPDSLYAVEHDSMDTSFRAMFYGLSAFMDANKERRNLLLGRREPCFEEVKTTHFIDDFDRVTQKAVAARDYFLLVGPPGTGKTSGALNRMVRTFHQEVHTNILLLAYTNRAVDEICKSLSTITPELDYMRVGSELTCDARFREHLLENALAACRNRKDVLRRMDACRIYVGTVASIAPKTELFKLKRFDVAIIDEATQILEPQLLGILCGKTPNGQDAVGKFILIGDHKQLPAIVLQDKVHSEVRSEELRAVGMQNLKDSLFERLYRYHLSTGDGRAVDMLDKQGRMHPDVAKFANEAFYDGKLKMVGLPHQLEVLEAPVVFIPSEVDKESPTGKSNRDEARIVADCAVSVWREFQESFDADSTLGIITPYRSQIALIKKELERTGIDDLLRISVDTVERYQGSERDVIIYSFCVNTSAQLMLLPNLTEENGAVIDRKLNVVLTRARKRIVITGNPDLLRKDEIYARLLDSIQ